MVAGTLDVPGQTATYTLSLPEAKTFYLDSLSGITNNNGSYPFNLQISGPRIGFNENLTYFYNRLVTLPAGDYTITVDGNGRPTGPYAFRFIDTAAAQQFSYGDAVSGDLNPGDTAKLFSFDATAGDAAYFNNLGASGFNPAWRLIDPFGREVFGRTGIADRDTTTLAYTGRYLLIVDGDYGNNDQQSHFSFRLNNVTATTTKTFDIAIGLDAGVQRTAGQGLYEGGVGGLAVGGFVGDAQLPGAKLLHTEGAHGVVDAKAQRPVERHGQAGCGRGARVLHREPGHHPRRLAR